MDLRLLPEPRRVQMMKGYFNFSEKTTISMIGVAAREALGLAKELKSQMEATLGIDVSISSGFQDSPIRDLGIRLRYQEGDREAYTLSVDSEGIEIIGDHPGLFYGVQTLLQLIKQFGTQLPLLQIEDAPYFANRGILLDVTRGKVPTVATIKEMIDLLAHYKMNQVQLYIEHTFAFSFLTEVRMGKDALTAEDILEIDAYCREKHMELVPCIATFGHLFEVLASDSYKHLCEYEHFEDLPYSWMKRQTHHTIDCINPDSFTLIQRMLDEFIPLFSSNQFNICCDETFDIGNGRNRGLRDQIGAHRLYMDFLKKIIAHVKGYDKRVMFFGDVIIRHHELLQELPEDMICMNWNYDAYPSDEDTKTFAASGLDQYVCPGVSGWNRFVNNFPVAFENISRMIDYGRQHGAIGVLNTDWGDFGHINLFSTSVPVVIYGAHLSWNPDGNKEVNAFNQKLSYLHYQDLKGEMMEPLMALAKDHGMTWVDLMKWHYYMTQGTNYYGNSTDIFTQTSEEFYKHTYDQSVAQCQRLVQMLPGVPSEKRRDVREWILMGRMIGLVNSLSLVLKKYQFHQEIKVVHEPKELAIHLEEWFLEYETKWRERNRESELFRIREVIQSLCHHLRMF